MKKSFLFILFSVLYIQAFSQKISIEELRKELYKVSADSASCAKLYKKITEVTNPDNLTNGYKGAITASMANYPKDKSAKLKLFNTGKKLLEQSISSDSTNIELRFLRFTVQTSCPKALGYNKQITSDKNFILKNFPATKNAAVKKMIRSFLLQGNYLGEAEKQKLES